MYNPYLEHSGVKGMHWGVRRYQNHDGSLTPAGRAHYGVGPARKFKTTVGSALKAVKKAAKTSGRAVKKSVRSTLKTIKTKRAEHKVKSEARAERKLTKAIAKGNVDKILKGLDRMNDKELNDALNRARNVKMLKDLKAPKKSITEKLGDVAGTVTKGAIAAQNIAKARREKLNYRKEKEAYERGEEKRLKEERDAWEKEHANDPKASERLRSALNSAKDLGSRMKSKLDDWEPYDTNEKRPPKKDTYDRHYDEEWEPKKNGLGSALKQLTGSTSNSRLISGPSYTPNFKEGKTKIYGGERPITGLLSDLSKPKTSKPKISKADEQKVWSEILEMTNRRSKASRNNVIDVDLDDDVIKRLRRNKKKLKDQGYM